MIDLISLFAMKTPELNTTYFLIVIHLLDVLDGLKAVKMQGFSGFKAVILRRVFLLCRAQ